MLLTLLTLTPGCPGVEKFLPISGAAGKPNLWCGRPRFLAQTCVARRVLEKLCTETVCVDFLVPTNGKEQKVIWAHNHYWILDLPLDWLLPTSSTPGLAHQNLTVGFYTEQALRP